VPLEVQAALARADTFALKIALLLAWDRGEARQGSPWLLQEDIILWAIRLTEIHVQSSLTIGQRLATNFDMRDRRRMLESLTEEPQKLGEVMGRAKMLKMRAKVILESLLEEELVKFATDGSGNTGFVLAKPLKHVTLDSMGYQSVDSLGLTTSGDEGVTSNTALNASSADSLGLGLAAGAAGAGAAEPPTVFVDDDEDSFMPIWDE
jgi:hypothetical protein